MTAIKKHYSKKSPQYKIFSSGNKVDVVKGKSRFRYSIHCVIKI